MEAVPHACAWGKAALTTVKTYSLHHRFLWSTSIGKSYLTTRKSLSLSQGFGYDLSDPTSASRVPTLPTPDFPVRCNLDVTGTIATQTRFELSASSCTCLVQQYSVHDLCIEARASQKRSWPFCTGSMTILPHPSGTTPREMAAVLLLAIYALPYSIQPRRRTYYRNANQVRR